MNVKTRPQYASYVALVRGLGSRWCTAAILIAFTLQASWIALSARLVIYDEEYHLAAIKAFSLRATPIINQQLSDGEIGDAQRYGSWVYHYLMSWPWRILGAAGMGDEGRTLVLRLLTVLMVTAALLLLRSLVLELGGTLAVANVALLLVSGTPLLVFLAGAVSYDNMLMLMAAGFVLVAVRLWKAERFDIGGWLAVIALGTFGSLTKYTFLPVVAFIGVALIIRQFSLLRAEFRPAASSYLRGLDRTTLARRIGLLVAAVAGVLAFIERYIVNLVQYRALTPACEQVHSTAICEMFAPWVRNTELKANFEGLPMSPSTFLDYLSNQWVPLMLRYANLIGIVNANDEPIATSGPNITGAIAMAFVAALLVAIVLCWGAIQQIGGARLLLGATVFYLAVLFLQNYTDYLSMGVAVGVAGRYALLVYPLVIAVVCIAVSRVLTSTSRSGGRGVKSLLVVGLVLALLQGGGFLSYLWSLDSTWLKDETSTVGRVTLRLNDLSRSIVLPNELVRDPRF